MGTMVCRFILAAALVITLGMYPLTGKELEKAPEIRRSDIWINSSPLTLKALKGKVVLVDFWAFDCAPCIEAMPYVQRLFDKYSKGGLVVLGVHTPRAEYEKELPKLREAIKSMKIGFPVVVDNNQKIWTDYRCDLWPTQFIIDKNGMIRYSHGGVGRYEDLEMAVQTLLKEN